MSDDKTDRRSLRDELDGIARSLDQFPEGTSYERWVGRAETAFELWKKKARRTLPPEHLRILGLDPDIDDVLGRGGERHLALAERIEGVAGGLEVLETEPSADQGQSRLAPSRVKHVVAVIHGIRTQAAWQEMVGHVLETTIPELKFASIRYGYLDLPRFLFPILTRQGPIRRVSDVLAGLKNTYPNAVISVIAHSFGTYVISRLLLTDSFLKLHRLILCGSIIPTTFPWNRVSHQINDTVLNDCGAQDIWPVLAKATTWGYGPSGTFGFGQPQKVRDRFHPARHSDYFDETFVRQYWTPYIASGEIRPTEHEVNRRASSFLWNQLALGWLKYLLIAVGMFLVFGRFANTWVSVSSQAPDPTRASAGQKATESGADNALNMDLKAQPPAVPQGIVKHTPRIRVFVREQTSLREDLPFCQELTVQSDVVVSKPTVTIEADAPIARMSIGKNAVTSKGPVGANGYRTSLLDLDLTPAAPLVFLVWAKRPFRIVRVDVPGSEGSAPSPEPRGLPAAANTPSPAAQVKDLTFSIDCQLQVREVVSTSIHVLDLWHNGKECPSGLAEYFNTKHEDRLLPEREDDSWPYGYRCHAVNYGSVPLFDVQFRVRSTFMQSVSGGAGYAPTSVRSGADVMDCAFTVQLPAPLEPGRDRGFLFYVRNRSTEFASVFLPEVATFLLGNDRERRTIAVMGSPAGPMSLAPKRVKE